MQAQAPAQSQTGSGSVRAGSVLTQNHANHGGAATAQQSTPSQQFKKSQLGSGTSTSSTSQSQNSTNTSGKHARNDAMHGREEERRRHEEERRRHEERLRREREREALLLANGQLALPLGADRVAINVLHNVHTMLRNADADYAGHRASAMNHVSTALHRLGASAPMGTGMGLNTMPQSQSDQKLRDSLTQLGIAHRDLSTRTNIMDHHRSAIVSVDAAMRELRVALNIR
jgi:hypothetical protein